MPIDLDHCYDAGVEMLGERGHTSSEIFFVRENEHSMMWRLHYKIVRKQTWNHLFNAHQTCGECPTNNLLNCLGRYV